MSAASLDKTYRSAKKFILTGIEQITGHTPYRNSDFLVSAAPVPTSLAILALYLNKHKNRRAIAAGLKYLDATRLPGGRWGNLPSGPANNWATNICDNCLNAIQKSTEINQAIVQNAKLISQTWVMDFARLGPEWLPKLNSPIMKLIEALIGKSFVPDLDSITLKDLKAISRYMPPYGRPNLLAVTLIKEINRNGRTAEVEDAAQQLYTWMSPDGSFCEDIIITSLSAMALYLSGLEISLEPVWEWLCKIQYGNGGWPSFNQLFNWAVGWSAQILGDLEPGLLAKTTPYLLNAMNSDGSLGTIPPYSHPDLDDTAVGVLGLCADTHLDPRAFHRSIDLMLSLQNSNGSWSTFPSFSGKPPNAQSEPPIYITSEDVTVHVLQSLLKSGLKPENAQIAHGINWLKKRQHRDGAWNSTWFLGQTYSTAQALDLFLTVEPESDSVKRALHYLLSKQKQDGSWETGSAGETGLALYALQRSGLDSGSSPFTRGIDYLLSLIQPNGSFRPFYSGFYASALYYEEPLSEALAALRALRAMS